MAETTNDYETFIQQDFSRLPVGESMILDFGDDYSVLVCHDLSWPDQYEILLINNVNGAFKRFTSPAEDLKIRISRAVKIAAADVRNLYETRADGHPCLE